MRELVLDVETTGLEWQNGDRITEIACLELIDKEPTGNYFQKYIFPERLVSDENIAITGLTNDFLKDKQRFIEIADEFLAFIQNDQLIAHNAKFDIGFINFELSRCFYNKLTNPVVDTLMIARRKFSSNNSLNALCKRYKISLHTRKTHGALIDCKLLAKVYGFLCFEEDNFSFSSDLENNKLNSQEQYQIPIRSQAEISEEELEKHKKMQEKIGFKDF